MNEEINLTYEQAYARLEEIVESMNEASVPLEKLMELYEEGMKLSAHCEKLLKGYEAKLEQVGKQTLLSEMETGEDEPCDEEEAPF